MDNIKARSLRSLRVEEQQDKYASVTWEQLQGSLLDRVTLRNLSPQYRVFLRDNLARWRKELEEIPPQTVTTKDLERAILGWMKAGLSTTTINHRIRTIKIAFAHAEKEGTVKENPAKGLDKQKGQVEPIHAFTNEQVRALLSQPDKTTFVGYRDYCIMLVLLDSGVRLKELLGVNLDDVDLDRGVIRLNPETTKGRKYREVYIQKRCVEALKTYLKYRGEAGVDTDALWLSTNGVALSRTDLQGRIKAYGRMAGVKGARCSPHTFRHTFARMFIMAGGDGLVLMQILGHTAMDMVRRYVNLWSVDKKRLHAKFSPVENLF